jgi:hypothetical protein
LDRCGKVVVVGRMEIGSNEVSYIHGARAHNHSFTASLASHV